MRYKGHNWRRSRTIVTLPELDGVNVQFGKICDKDTPGAIMTNWTRSWDGGTPEVIYAKKIEGTGYSLTNMMYGKRFVRDGEVRERAYLAYDGRVYTTSWVHEEETLYYQVKKYEEKQEKKNNGK